MGGILLWQNIQHFLIYLIKWCGKTLRFSSKGLSLADVVALLYVVYIDNLGVGWYI
jgi:hypothetical protein